MIQNFQNKVCQNLIIGVLGVHKGRKKEKEMNKKQTNMNETNIILKQSMKWIKNKQT